MEYERSTATDAPPSPFRPQHGRFRDRLGFGVAVALVIAVPVAVTGWVVATQLEARDEGRVNARLESGLRIAQAELALRLAAADGRARALARTKVVQRAILEHDSKPLRPFARRTPTLAVYASGDRLVGAPLADAIVRRVGVLDPAGRPLGRVEIAIPIDDELVRSLGRRAGTMLAATRGGLIVAGAAFDDGRDYWTVRAALPAANGELVAGVPAAELEATIAERRRNVALAALATFLTLVLFAEALVPIVRRKVRRRSPVEEDESIALLGSALVAAHDRTALLPVILETMVDATGAVGGTLLEGDVEVGAVGERPPLAEPLRLTIAGKNGSESVVLLYPPFGSFGDVERRRAERLAAQASVAVEHARQSAIARRGREHRPSHRPCQSPQVRRAACCGGQPPLPLGTSGSARRRRPRRLREAS